MRLTEERTALQGKRWPPSGGGIRQRGSQLVERSGSAHRVLPHRGPAFSTRSPPALRCRSDSDSRAGPARKGAPFLAALRYSRLFERDWR
ncbi:MAG: hypothetical protein M3198_19945, partial [Actinomycetota bacterium]|nr:hypothetical protein [Actinomycetota bacterium]